MTRLLITIVLLTSLNGGAAAQTLELIERATELMLDEVALPTALGSTVNFKDCPSCAVSTHRTTNTTVFVANGQTLSLADFLRLAEEIRVRDKDESTFVTVYLDIATGVVTRVALRG
jgi:hypothetical protein